MVGSVHLALARNVKARFPHQSLATIKRSPSSPTDFAVELTRSPRRTVVARSGRVSTKPMPAIAADRHLDRRWKSRFLPVTRPQTWNSPQ